MIVPVLSRMRFILASLLLVAITGLAAPAAATVSLTASLGTLPSSGVIGTAFSGSFQCMNSGTESVANVTCAVAGLPNWASVGACSPSVPVASLPVAPPGLAGIVDTIRCSVTGMPTATGVFTLTVTASGDGTTHVASRSIHIFSTPTALNVSLTLPPALVGQAYSGNVVCSTVGTVAPTNWGCGVTGLPGWVTKVCLPAGGSSTIICILGGTPNAPGTSSITLTTTADNAVTASTAGSLRVTSRLCDLDVTGEGVLNPATNGLLMLRRLLGLSGQPLVEGLGSLNYSAAELQQFADNRKYAGLESQPTALVTGQIVLRLMQSVADNQLLVGTTLPASATLTTAAAVRADVNAKCGANF